MTRARFRAGRWPGLRQLPGRLRGRAEAGIFFESWHGRCADSPRAVSEALRRQDAPVEQTWAYEGGEPPPTRVVAPDGLRYLDALARARWLVTNNTMPGYYRKQPGTRYVQTWHGTPLKRIGYDIEAPAFGTRRELRRMLAHDVARWDILISPNAFSTEIFRGAFRFDGEIAETGYPRVDPLLAPDREERRGRVRRRLGLAPAARAVLYAPTWRDGTSLAAAPGPSDLVPELGEEDVLLFRAHHLDAGRRAAGGPRVLDVSSWSDATDLMLAADVLVTDYSSLMFDWAATGRPVLFFTYDLPSYRDELRGFYFPFEEQAPGPLLATPAEVGAALRELPAIGAEYAGAYTRFRDVFCHRDDGRATQRVVAALGLAPAEEGARNRR